MRDPERIKSLLAKLAALTVANGATEEEAMAAAAKARDLCDQYGLDMQGLEFDEIAVAIGRKRYRPIDMLWPHIAVYASCSMFYREGLSLHVVYVGAPHHLALAKWLHDMLVAHIKRAAETYKDTASYQRRASHRRRIAAAAFVEAMALTLSRRLAAQRGDVQQIAAATAAMMRRHDLAGEAKLPSVTGIRNNDSARRAGQLAAHGVAISPPMTGGGTPLMLGA